MLKMDKHDVIYNKCNDYEGESMYIGQTGRNLKTALSNTKGITNQKQSRPTIQRPSNIQNKPDALLILRPHRF